MHIAAQPALKAGAGQAAYAASKAAVLRLVEAIAAEHRKDRIIANAILPGTIDTPQNRADMPDAKPDTFVPPQAIAELIAFLVSPRAAAVTGGAIRPRASSDRIALTAARSPAHHRAPKGAGPHDTARQGARAADLARPHQRRAARWRLTNVNVLVTDGDRRAVVRIGDDIPVHQILRSNELAASRAAHAAGVSPEVLYHERGVLVIDFVEGRTMTPADLRDDALLDQALDLVMRAPSRHSRPSPGPGDAVLGVPCPARLCGHPARGA